MIDHRGSAGHGKHAALSVAAGRRRRLLAWYDRARRDLPWRAPPGLTTDPYAVWISEIMLQQTTVAAVIPYFERFMARWPSVADLARAPLDEVLCVWQGLGYYARARNLHACAKVVVERFGGRLPDREDQLRQLPGIGVYTAAAIAAIAFNREATPVDGNVLRVIARLHGITTPLPEARAEIVARARAVTRFGDGRGDNGDGRFGDVAQAMMDLGAGICTPRRPDCRRCPWQDDCVAAGNDPERYPFAAPKPGRPTRHGVVFWVEGAGGTVLLRRRPVSGLLGGMMELPSTAWRDVPWTFEEALAFAPCDARWIALPGQVRHTFTHFHLRLSVLSGQTAATDPGDGLWWPMTRLAEQPLPTVMRKVAALAGDSAGPGYSS